MLIYTQNKQGIVNEFTHIEVITGKHNIVASVGKGRVLLGSYNDLERCEAVVEEIVCAYANGEKVYWMPWE